MKQLVLPILGSLALAHGVARACDLCAIYSATDARGESGEGFVFTVAGQFVPFRTPQFEGEEVVSFSGDFLDDSITHFVPGYNFNPRFGLSVNVPLVYKTFQRSDWRYIAGGTQTFEVERGHETGLGDIALIARGTVWSVNRSKYGVTVNALAGIKFPTGDSDRIKDEVEQTIIYDALLPPGTPHDPLGHASSGIHQHDLSPGSGSFDGIFGLTFNSRWTRWFFNGQVQYYLRTEAEGFEYGDELLVSGGPGVYLVLKEGFTFNLQAVAVYETMARDRVLGTKSDRTGSTAWYAGPQVTLTWSDGFSAQAGADLPLYVSNNGFQFVPNFRFHGGFSLRF